MKRILGLLGLAFCLICCVNSDRIKPSFVKLKDSCLIYELEHYENGFFYIKSKKIVVGSDTIIFISNRGATGNIIRNNEYLEEELGSDSLYFQDDLLLSITNHGLNDLEKELYHYVDDNSIVSKHLYRNKNKKLNIIAEFTGEVILLDNYHYDLTNPEYPDSILESVNNLCIFNELTKIDQFKRTSNFESLSDTVNLIFLE
ncbi:hypothetical protein [Crocinitomix algicola]|uniref:hypothetical protein n=1 Tax=Crocinitomix algicola TaxID=1740263 RepID=UPI0008733D7E|nr:hypothetical protein [Crocinitomix algicola]